MCMAQNWTTISSHPLISLKKTGMGHADHAESDQSHRFFHPLAPHFRAFSAAFAACHLANRCLAALPGPRGRDGSFFGCFRPNLGKSRTGDTPWFSSIFIYLHQSSSLYPIGSMYAIYGNIYHQYTIPQMLAYIPYMDPMGIILYFTGKSWKIHGFPADVPPKNRGTANFAAFGPASGARGKAWGSPTFFTGKRPLW